MTSLRNHYRSVMAWMRRPPVLMRWKVCVTAVAVFLVVSGLYFQTQTLNEQRQHETECARAEGRDALRLVLFRITALSEIFPTSDAIQLYETSTHAIIEAALPPIVVDDCPETVSTT